MTHTHKECPICSRTVKPCPHCSALNRSFSSYCTECGQDIETGTAWSGYKGNGERKSVNTGFQCKHKDFFDYRFNEIGEIRIQGHLKSILLYDDHIFVFSQKGELLIYRIHESDIRKTGSYNLMGSVYAEPAIEKGILYVAAEKTIYAFSLSELYQSEKSFSYLWKQTLNATPIRALLPCENSLYVNLKINANHEEIHVIDNARTQSPTSSVCLTKAMKMSMLAGNTKSDPKTIYFLSDNRNQSNTRLTIIEQKNSIRNNIISLELSPVPPGFVDSIPIAIADSSLFAVMKDKTLYRFDIDMNHHKIVNCQSVHKHVRHYALLNKLFPVVADMSGVFIYRPKIAIEKIGNERMSCPPLILNHCLLAIGLMNGSIEFYDISNKCLPTIWNISDLTNEAVTGVVSSKNIIAAGNQNGLVKICNFS